MHNFHYGQLKFPTGGLVMRRSETVASGFGGVKEDLGADYH